MPPSSSVLARELVAVSKRQISRLFDPLYGKSVDAPELYELVRSLDPEAWQASRVEALYVAIGKAASRLAHENVREGRSLTFGYVITKLFNLEREDLGHVDDHHYDYLLKQMFPAASDAALKKKVAAKIRLRLAKELLDMAQETTRGQQQSIDTIATPSQTDILSADQALQGYISRPAYEEWLKERHREGARIFLLHGDAGTGKSTLARFFGHFCASASPTSLGQAKASPLVGLVELDARTPGSLLDDVIRILDRNRIGIPTRDVLVREQFKELASEGRAFRVMLLDNVEDWHDVAALIPAAPQATIIITSRYRLPTSEGVVTLQIGEMTADEAVALVDSQLPNVSEVEGFKLADTLGNRPLAISHACGFLSEEKDVTVGVFCRLLQQSIAAVLDTVVDDEPTLTAIYRMSIERLTPDALHMLDLIAAMGGGNATYEFFRAAWSGGDLLDIAYGVSSVGDLRFMQAVRTLERRNIVQVAEISQGIDRAIWMHSLTARILAELRSQSCAHIQESLLQLIENSPTLRAWRLGRAPYSLELQILHVRYLLDLLEPRVSGEVPNPYPHFTKLATLRRYSLGSMGRADLVLRDMIGKYSHMRRLAQMTPQRRQEQFNDLIAELFRWWDVDDVKAVVEPGYQPALTFTIGGVSFLLNASWESAPIDVASVANFRARVAGRAADTIRGAVLAMSGYEDQVRNSALQGDQPDIFMLDQSHLEAMLSGLLSPHDLFVELLNRSYYRREVYAAVRDFVVPSDLAPLPSLATGLPPGDTAEIAKEMTPGIQAKVVMHVTEPTNTRVEGLAVAMDERLLLTVASGVVRVDVDSGSIDWAVPIPGCQRAAFPNADGSILVICGGAVLRWDGSDIRAIAGGFSISSSLLTGPDGEVWVFDYQLRLWEGNRRTVTLTRLGTELGDEHHYTIESPGHAWGAAWLAWHGFLIAGDEDFEVINLDTMAIMAVGSPPMSSRYGRPELIRVDWHTVMAASVRGQIYRIDLETGESSPVLLLDVFGAGCSLATGPNGRIYVLGYRGGPGSFTPVVTALSKPSE